MRFIALVMALVAGWFTSTMFSQIKVTDSPDVILNQHWAMPTLLNPSATGDIDYIRIRGGARLDYLGSRESPKYFLAAADSPFKLLGKRIGAGVVIDSYSYGVFRNLLVSAQGSYKLKIRSSTLSIGLQIGYYHTKFKGTEYIIYNKPTGGEDSGGTVPDEGASGDMEGDSGYDEGDDDNYMPDYPTEDVGAGALDLALGVRFTHPKFHVGLSVLHLTNPTLKLGREGEELTNENRILQSHLPMTMYFDAGGNIAVNNSLFTLQPSILVGTDFSDFTGVAQMRATYNQKITFGLNYRWNRAAGVLAGLILKDFYIGYSWEYDYKNIPRGSTGNHELVLGYQFKMDQGGKSNFRQRSIRIM